MKKEIPVGVARHIGVEYGYDQVVIIARKTGQDGGEHVTTHGITDAHAKIAARMGNYLKERILGWIGQVRSTPRLTGKQIATLERIVAAHDTRTPIAVDVDTANSIDGLLTWYKEMEKV